MRARATVLAIGIATMLFAFFVVHTRAPMNAPVFRDFESYYAGGATWRYGGDPYSREVWRTERTVPKVVLTRDELLPFVGPPFGLPIWAAISRFSWTGATILWAAALAVSLAVLVFAGLQLGPSAGRRTEHAMRTLAAALFAASFAPVTSGISLGQVAIVSCAAVALVPALLRGRRTIAKTLVATLVAGLQPNIALVLVTRISNVRSAVAIVGAGVIALCGSALALAHYEGVPHYARVLAEHSAAERAIAIQTTIGAVARGLGATPDIAAVLAISVALLTVATLGYQFYSRRYVPDDRLLLASCALPLLWPFAHEHDFAVTFVPALVLVSRARGRLWFLASFAALLVAADWLGLAQRPGGEDFEALRVFAGALALVVLAPPQPLRARAFAPAIVALAMFAVGVYASAHPLGVWPDDLSQTFRVPLAFDSAQTWGAEQVGAGVSRFTPLNAALRALSLLGCALLWLAASIVLRADARAATVRSSRPEPAYPPASRSLRVQER